MRATVAKTPVVADAVTRHVLQAVEAPGFSQTSPRTDASAALQRLATEAPCAARLSALQTHVDESARIRSGQISQRRATEARTAPLPVAELVQAKAADLADGVGAPIQAYAEPDRSPTRQGRVGARHGTIQRIEETDPLIANDDGPQGQYLKLFAEAAGQILMAVGIAVAASLAAAGTKGILFMPMVGRVAASSAQAFVGISKFIRGMLIWYRVKKAPLGGLIAFEGLAATAAAGLSFFAGPGAVLRVFQAVLGAGSGILKIVRGLAGKGNYFSGIAIAVEALTSGVGGILGFVSKMINPNSEALDKIMEGVVQGLMTIVSGIKFVRGVVTARTPSDQPDSSGGARDPELGSND